MCCNKLKEVGGAQETSVAVDSQQLDCYTARTTHRSVLCDMGETPYCVSRNDILPSCSFKQFLVTSAQVSPGGLKTVMVSQVKLYYGSLREKSQESEDKRDAHHGGRTARQSARYDRVRLAWH